MTEHEKLKEMADKIWYEINYKFKITYYEQIAECEYRTIDVREIIFTQEFMNKYMKYLKVEKNFWNPTIIIYWLFENLQDPVWYLYSIIK